MTDLTLKERKRLRGQADTKAKKYLRKQADALWQQCVKMEHPRCEVCREPTQVGHHYWTKGSSAELRYDLLNGVGLCNGCHLQHHKGSPEATMAAIRARGDAWTDDLSARRHTLRKRNTAYYEGEIERLTERLGGLEDET